MRTAAERFSRRLFFILAAALAGYSFAFPELSVAAESLSATVELPRVKRASPPWGKDPFVPLVAVTTTAPALKLTAIFYNAAKPSAIINGAIVYAGDIIGGQKVIAIEKTRVILQGEAGRVKLDIADTAPEPKDDKK